jgi:glycosyltransferase involved in cell wall biosynthesis
MRSLPDLLRRRRSCQVVVVGGAGVSYGAPPAQGGSWLDRVTAEVRPNIPDEDWRRVHFTGRIAYPTFLRLLQVSAVHVYLTYPFVLSWSLLEAMSAGCPVVASDTAPVREFVTHGATGVLVDFFDTAGFSAAISDLLDDPDRRRMLGANARALIEEHYDRRAICLPAQLAWVDRLAATPAA